MELITAKPSSIQVFKLLDIPERAIIMTHCPLESMVDADIVSENKYVTSWRQILDSLSHLHKRKIAHLDLKPENFLVKMGPLFKVVIADFGIAKVVTDSVLLQTFCSSLKYAAPEVFPNLSSGYRPSVDIWSLGIIVFEWIYGIPNSSNPSHREKRTKEPQTGNCATGSTRRLQWSSTNWETKKTKGYPDPGSHD